MDKIYVDEGGEIEEYLGHERRRHIRFPVYLAIRYSDDVDIFDSFVLNLSKEGVFIETGFSLPIGSKIVIHLYIPPENKLLGVLKGEVVHVNQNNHAYPRGMHIRFVDNDRGEIQRLEEYLEERIHLIDMEI